jgi:hypothetical protein
MDLLIKLVRADSSFIVFLWQSSLFNHLHEGGALFWEVNVFEFVY